MKPNPFFQVKADGDDIEHYRLRRGDVTVSYSPQFDWLQAQAASGLSAKEFEQLPGNPMWVLDTLSKAHYYVWYKFSRLIDATFSEAQARKMDAEKRQRGG